MPYRKIPIVTDHTYHIINRGFQREKIFTHQLDYSRALQAINFYRFDNPLYKFSYFFGQPINRQNQIINQFMDDQLEAVKIYAYCLMPNHFHLLVNQLKDNGILKFIGNFSNSYSKYFNRQYERRGSLFEGRYQAVKISSNNQLLHVHRYIHLNPYSAKLVNSHSNLKKFPYSSLKEYLNQSTQKISSPHEIYSQFKSSLEYQSFIFDHADHQRTLQEIKHLILE